MAQTPGEMRARDNINEGVRAYRAARYEVAIGYFQEAIRLDPRSTTAELYLATAYAQQFVPGPRSEQNEQFANKAIEGFGNVLKKEPNNVGAVAGLAGIYQNTQQHLKAREYFVRLAELAPLNPTAFYQVGAVTWIIVADKGSTQLPEEKERLIEEGLRHLDIALAIDQDYEEAMAYKNLLFREKAKLTSDETEKRALIVEADRWFNRALETRKKNQQAGRSSATAPALPPPPPPPPPPPAVVRISQGAIERNLISRPEIVYPAEARQARIQGSVILEAFINKDGSVRNLRTISGHPLLIQAAMENAKLWRYQPILMNGQPTEVVTTITVNFQLQ